MLPFIKRILILSCWLILCSQVSSYKILVISPLAVRSHYNLGKGVADILHDRKHEITFISPFKTEKPVYREIAVTNIMALRNESKFTVDKMLTQSLKDTVGMITHLTTILTRLILEHPEVKELYNNEKKKFDLVVLEHFFNDAMIGFGVKFDCPVVLISPVSMMSWLATFTGNPISPATVPNVFLPLANNMNLIQRTINTGMALYQEFLGWWIIHPKQKALYEETFTVESNIIPYEKLSSKIALVFINSHPSLNIARPLLPNAIEIGGYHIPEVKPLPEDLQKLMDNAKDGVIYFSMGSNLKSSSFPEKMINDILKSFSKIKQTVLWKFEKELPGKPDNVIIKSWMPQDSILAHQNIKLFISHSGLLSMTETVHYGVPVLSIPIYGDQQFNALGAEERGHGLTVQYTNLTETSLTWALNEMLTNPKYKENASKLHRLYHDRPMKPKDLVSFYVEHVIRSGGALHLTPPKISRCSELLLDVMALILIPILMILAILAFTCRKCFKIKTDKKIQKDVNKKKKN